MAINTKRTSGDEYNRYMKLFIGGSPGAGKTLISSTFPHPYYVSAEGGMMSLAGKGIPYHELETRAELLELKDMFSQSSKVREQMFGFPVETAVIDTIDEVAKILVQERLVAQHKEAMAIQDWGWLGDELRNIIRGFRNLEMNVIFLSHLKTQEDNENGGMMVKPAIQGAVGDEIAQYVDLALLLQASATIVPGASGQSERKVTRYLRTYPDARYPWIKDRSGKLPMEVLVNFEDDWKRLDALIYGDPGSADRQRIEEMTTMAKDLAQAVAPAQTVAPNPEPVVESKPELKLVQPEKKSFEPFPDDEGLPKAEPKVEAPEPEQIVPVQETPAPEPKVQEQKNPEPNPQGIVCDGCGGAVESQDQADLAQIRFRKTLCRACFAAEKKIK